MTTVSNPKEDHPRLQRLALQESGFSMETVRMKSYGRWPNDPCDCEQPVRARDCIGSAKGETYFSWRKSGFSGNDVKSPLSLSLTSPRPGGFVGVMPKIGLKQGNFRVASD